MKRLFFLGKRVKMTRYVSRLKRSWIRSWWKAVNAVKNDIHLYEFLLYFYSIYLKRQPQTTYVKLRADIEIGQQDGQVKKAEDPIYMPPMIERVHELPDQWDAHDQHSPERYQNITAAVAINNNVRAERMKSEMEESSAEESLTEKLIPELEQKFHELIHKAGETLSKYREATFQRISEIWNWIDSVQIFYIAAIILIAVGEAYLVFSTLADFFGILLNSPINNFKARPVAFTAYIAFSTTVTAALVALSHLIIDKLLKIYSLLLPKWKFASDISLIIVMLATLAVLASAMSDVRNEALEDPIHGSFHEGDANSGERMQLVMIVLLPLTLAHMSHRALERSKRKKEAGGGQIKLAHRESSHFNHEQEIKMLRNKIAEVRGRNQAAKAKISALYKEAEKELDVIKSLIRAEEKVLLAYIDALYGAIMADRFLFLNRALKKGKKHLTEPPAPDDGIGDSHRGFHVINNEDNTGEARRR